MLSFIEALHHTKTKVGIVIVMTLAIVMIITTLHETEIVSLGASLLPDWQSTASPSTIFKKERPLMCLQAYKEF